MPNTDITWADIYQRVLDETEREAQTPSESFCLSLANDFIRSLGSFDTAWHNDTGGDLLVVGNEVALPTNCRRVRRVEWNGSDEPLTKWELRDLDYERPGWRDETGDPDGVVILPTKLIFTSAPSDAAGKLVVRGDGYLTEFVADGTLIENCEDAWNASSNVTAATAAGIVGTNSASLTLAPDFTTGIIGYETLGSTVNVETAGYRYATFWLKSSVAIADLSVLYFAMDNNATMGALTRVVDALPQRALPANTWKKITVPLSAITALTSADSVGLVASTDLGALVLYIDDVRLSVGPGNPLESVDWGFQMLPAHYILRELPVDPSNGFETARLQRATRRFDDLQLGFAALQSALREKSQANAHY